MLHGLVTISNQKFPYIDISTSSENQWSDYSRKTLLHEEFAFDLDL